MIFIDAFEEEAIMYAEKHSFISGITTNPLILNKVNASFSQAVNRLSRVKGIHFIQISIYDRSWKDILVGVEREKFVLKIPWDIEKSSEIVTIVKGLGFKSCATAVYTVAQFITSMVLNVDYVAVYYDRMKRNSIDPDTFIKDIIQIRGASPKPRIIVASLKKVEDVDIVLREGADDITLPLALCKRYFKVTPPEDDIKVFEEHFRLK